MFVWCVVGVWGIGREEGNCRAEGVTYSIECRVCGCVYFGETARNAHTRGLEHSASVSRKDMRSPLYLHCAEQHQGTLVDFDMRVTGTFGGDALKRQIIESVQIQGTDLLMNRRDEWRQTILPRTSLCRGKPTAAARPRGYQPPLRIEPTTDPRRGIAGRADGGLTTTPDSRQASGVTWRGGSNNVEWQLPAIPAWGGVQLRSLQSHAG